MSTERIVLTSEPQLVSDGTMNASVNAGGETVYFADSDTQPSDLTMYDTMTGRLGFGVNVKIWMWSDRNTGPTIAVTKWSE
ncbi:hypothetical protein [Pantoea endophytica]